MRAAIFALVLAGCQAVPLGHELECEVAIASPSPRVVDLLFVLDVRGADAQGRGRVLDRATALVDDLEQQSTAQAPLSLHVGIVSSDPARGTLLEPIAGRVFAEWLAWGHRTSTAAIREALGAVPVPGGARLPLEVLRRTLVQPIPGNFYFQRDDSELIAIVLSDGDDEGTSDAAGEGNLFTASTTTGGLRADPRAAHLGVVSGPCRTAELEAADAPRLHAIAEANVVLCDSSYAAALPPSALLLSEPACLVASTPEFDAFVYDEYNAFDLLIDQSLPACGDPVAPPCYRIASDRACPGGLAVEVERAVGAFAPPGNVTHVFYACDARPSDFRSAAAGTTMPR